MTTKRSDDLHYLWWLALVASVGLLFYLLGPILTPFMFAAILAYICDPLVDKLEAHKFPRTAGVVLTLFFLLVLFVALVLILVPLLERETQLFIAHFPGYVNWFQAQLAPHLLAFGVDFQLDGEMLKDTLVAHWQSAGGVAVQILPSLTSGGIALIGFLANLVLVPVVLFYLLRDWDVMVARLDELVPRRWHPKVADIARKIDQVLGEFLRGQIMVMLLMSLYYVIGLWLVGLDYALPIGVVAGLLVFVPYLGMMLGLSLATLAGAMQFQALGALIPVWIVFGAGQLLEGTIVTPWLVGERIGLHPVVVIFALLAFGQLFGFFGILLALPASAALLVGLRELRQKYLDSSTYNA